MNSKKAVQTDGKAGRVEVPRRGMVAEWTVTIILLLFGTTTLVQAFVIPTGSMKESLLIGDHLLVDKLAYAPAARSDSISCPTRTSRGATSSSSRYPRDLSQTYVKRAVGIPGDRVRMVDKQLFINGEPVEEPYVSHKLRTSYVDAYRDNFPATPDVRVYQRGRTMLENHVVDGEVVVPPGQYFAMGDNRDSSDDSRFWGFVPRENIIGKPLIIYWSYDAPTHRLQDSSISLAHIKDLVLNFFSKTRWGRTFNLIRSHELTAP